MFRIMDRVVKYSLLAVDLVHIGKRMEILPPAELSLTRIERISACDVNYVPTVTFLPTILVFGPSGVDRRDWQEWTMEE